MNTRIFKTIALFIIPLLMGSCVYDFTPDSDKLPSMNEPMVVIEGDIIVGGTTIVKLRQTEHMLLGSPMPKINYSGAVVWVEGSNGEFCPGVEMGYGDYHVNTTELSVDGEYRLCVSVPGRGEYHSAFKKVAISPAIDTITCTIGDKRSSMQLAVSTHDDSKEPLYCRWTFVEDWESNSDFTPKLRGIKEGGVIRMEELSLAEQREMSRCFSRWESSGILIANTEKLSQNVIDKVKLVEIGSYDKRISSMYAITVTQTAMDKEAYGYWEGIQKSLDGEGLFAPMPYEVKGNIVSATDPQEKVLGYINVSTATHKRAMFSAQQLMIYSDISCEMEQHKEIVDGMNQWLSLYMNGYLVVDYALNDKGEYIKSEAMWAPRRCVDCRTFSNSTRPDFWPYE